MLKEPSWLVDSTATATRVGIAHIKPLQTQLDINLQTFPVAILSHTNMPPPPILIPQFLLPRGIPSKRTLLHLTRRHASTTTDPSKPRVLEKPDKFRPPSHPARRVVPTRNGKVVNYPGPRLSEEEKREKAQKQYPHMFPPEGSVMYKFLTNRGIHVWIAFVCLLIFPVCLAPGWIMMC